MKATWRQLIARKLRAVAGRLDPQGKPGRRKARIKAEVPLLYEINPHDPPSGYEIGSGQPHGWPEEPRA